MLKAVAISRKQTLIANIWLGVRGVARQGCALVSKMKHPQANLRRKDAYNTVLGFAKRVCKAIHNTITTNSLEPVRIY